MPAVLFEMRETVAVITLNRPEKYNAVNRELALLLQEKLDDCKQKEVRCVYLTGAGKGFCSGQDLTEITNLQEANVTHIVKEHYNPIVQKIRRLEKPVVAAVNGIAAGAGANLALCCDIVVATESAYFIQAFSKIGLIPDTGGTYFLPRLVGLQKATALAMLGDKVSAEEAERMNMIYKWFPDAAFAAQSFSIAHTLSQLPTRALALTKQAFNNSMINNWEDQLHDEELFQEQAGRTCDYVEGVQAFLEKRQPKFRGE